MKVHMDRFPARLPPELKRALAEKAELLPGTSMNDLVVLGVRHVVEGANLLVETTGIKDAHEDLVVGAIKGEIGPAKGIAGHYIEIGQHNLGALLYWAAARMQPDRRVAAAELVRTADRIQDRSHAIAKALFRAALDLNPASDVAKNRLGQVHYFDGEFEEAAQLLESVRDDDNYARLAYGWSTLELAQGEPEKARMAQSEIVIALKRWALGQHDSESRTKWIGQLRKLMDRGPDHEVAIDELIEYSNDNASWPLIDPSEINER